MDLMTQGLVLMVLGMLVVFGFLALMVVAMQASAAFFRKYSHVFEEQQEAAAPAAPTDHSEIAVVLAAIQAHTK